MDAIHSLLNHHKKLVRWAALPHHQPSIAWIVRGEKGYWTPNSGLISHESLTNKQNQSLYEIASITKTMVALRFAQGEQDGLWQASDSLAKLLPELEHIQLAHQVTLRQLATHTSGLPRLPKNISSTSIKAEKYNPYAAYDEALLIEALQQQKLPTEPKHLYSNYGYGLLSWAMGKSSGIDTAQALQQLLFHPLQMNETSMPTVTTDKSQTKTKATKKQKKNNPSSTIPGFAPNGHSMPNWDFTTAMAGAGAVRSTMPDMLTYIEAQLGQHPAAANLESALLSCQHEQASVAPSKGVGIGYAWMRSMRQDGTVTHWHNGATYGASSFAAFNRDLQSGFVVLSNRGVSTMGAIKQMFGVGELSTDQVANLIGEQVFAP
ncbi:serine hydrolase [Saccharibacillus sp. JS10]|uniref:serine hydrolase domain-containing protein n=1 Tax=Saccharibacillus sp. JS10 TaxID=2950552 RepID=UPI00210B62C4|nr:serine hydrolase [Saccharibacillus sp. JS10]MCQ4085957.1 beta-lactamase family protein [Saccharibacillus sp. JS10]